jgi:hypothetical protein
VVLLDLSCSALNVVAFCLLPFAPTITSRDEFQMNCPYTYEPFVVNRNLRPDKAITFQSGSKAKGRNELTTAYIYNSDVGSKEGARVRTSVGTFISKC